MSGMKLAKTLVGAELTLAVLSGVFAVVNHSMHAPAAVTAVFASLAGAAVLVAAVMASLLWLFTLPAGES